jgi:hypothetical protein
MPVLERWVALRFAASGEGTSGVIARVQCGGLSALLPKAFLFALATLFTFAAIPDRSHAAPVIETPAARELACTTGSVAPECLTVASATSAFGLIRAGGLLLSGAAVSVIQASESIVPVPLPAAGWLLVAGLGALGLFGRRREGALPTLRPARDGLEPVSTTLRSGVRGDAPAPLRARALIRGFGLRERLRDLMQMGERLRAFAPGRTSPVRPCGGAGMLWAATAERAPPMAAAVDRAPGVLPRAGRHGRIFMSGLNEFSTRMQGWIASLAARFSCAYDPMVFVMPAPRLVPVAVRCTTDNQNGSNPHRIPQSLRTLNGVRSAAVT